jgi:site-specific recombinase XerD
MARTAKTKLDSPTARKGLKPRAKPYCVTVAPRRMLGYVRPSAGAGRWVAIVEIGRGPSGAALRRRGDLGPNGAPALADDYTRADGVAVFSYSMAFAASAAWQPKDGPRTGPLTVRQGIESYVATKRAADGDAAANDAFGRLRLHVLREDMDGRALPGGAGFAQRPIESLTLTELREWRDHLVSREENPVSKSTANRIINDFKAMLNLAYSDETNGIGSDAAWRRLKGFKNADGSRVDHFEVGEMNRLLREARKQDAAFGDLLEATYHTGARPPMELALLHVRDFNDEHAQLKIRDGKTGPRVTTLTSEGVAFFKRVTRGKQPGDILLPREDGAQWGKSQQHRPMKAVLKAAKLPLTASMYTVRHTYISRAIENGMPLTLIAENVGTSVAMISKHYAHILARVRRELVERTAPRLRVVKAA